MAAYIKLFTDYTETLDDMSDEEAGRLIKALLHYGADGEIIDLPGAERLVFGIIRRQIDRDNESADAHRAAGGKGGRPRTKPNQTEPTETKQNQTKADKDKEEDKDKDKDKEEDVCRTKRRFVRPTVEEVGEYIREHGYQVDAQKFFDFYESKGWRVGNQPMQNWQAAVRTWTRNDRGGQPKKTVFAQQYEQRDYSQQAPEPMPEWMTERWKKMKEEGTA